jgi:GPI-anchor transamidase subunit T
MSFQPSGYHANSTLQNLHLLHGTLPREVVCTENLTPFLKLLPCKGKAGISSLLDGHKLFDASWQSMSIDVRPICEAGEENCQLQITQTIDMVLDIQRSKRPRGMYQVELSECVSNEDRQSYTSTCSTRRAQMRYLEALPLR